MALRQRREQTPRLIFVAGLAVGECPDYDGLHFSFSPIQRREKERET